MNQEDRAEGDPKGNLTSMYSKNEDPNAKPEDKIASEVADPDFDLKSVKSLNNSMVDNPETQSLVGNASNW